MIDVSVTFATHPGREGMMQAAFGKAVPTPQHRS
jgi:hypothetical protein